MGYSFGVALMLVASSAVAEPYQAQVLSVPSRAMGDGAKPQFPAVPSGKRLTVTNLSCVYTVQGSFIDAQLEYQVAGGTTMYLGLASEWQRPNGARTNGTFGKQTNLFIPSGKKSWAVVQISGSLIGAHCQQFGNLI